MVAPMTRGDLDERSRHVRRANFAAGDDRPRRR